MKRIDIEHLLRWAYRDELPKVAADRPLVAAIQSSWGSVTRFGALMTVVQEPDIAGRWGLVPLRTDDDAHPDALQLATMVEVLAGLVPDLPEGWNPLSDMGDLGPEGDDAIGRGLHLVFHIDEAGRRQMRQPLSRLVIRQAVLGDAPSWEAEPATRVSVRHANGTPRWFRKMERRFPGAFGDVVKHVEVDGFDFRSRRPFRGAYQKHELVPDPARAVADRAEYELWVSALHVLAEECRLSAHVVLPPARAARPWEREAKAPMILRSDAASPRSADIGNSIPA